MPVRLVSVLVGERGKEKGGGSPSYLEQQLEEPDNNRMDINGILGMGFLKLGTGFPETGNVTHCLILHPLEECTEDLCQTGFSRCLVDHILASQVDIIATSHSLKDSRTMDFHCATGHDS